MVTWHLNGTWREVSSTERTFMAFSGLCGVESCWWRQLKMEEGNHSLFSISAGL